MLLEAMNIRILWAKNTKFGSSFKLL